MRTTEDRVVALEVRAVRSAPGVRSALTPGRDPDLRAARVDVTAVPVHTWLPRREGARRQPRIEVWGYAEREALAYHSSVESQSAQIAITFANDRRDWPDLTDALERRGTLWTQGAPKVLDEVARGLIELRGRVQERALDLHDLLSAGAMSPPAEPSSVFAARAVVFPAAAGRERAVVDERPARVPVPLPDGRSVSCCVSVAEELRPSSLDSTFADERYLVVSIATDGDVQPDEALAVAGRLCDCLHHLARHEVLVRSARATNDRLSLQIGMLLDDETELHRVDNIKRQIAGLQQEFTDELEAAWAYDVGPATHAPELLAVLEGAIECVSRWRSQQRRFDRLGSIAGFAPEVGPPIRGPRELNQGGEQVGAKQGIQIRNERRVTRQMMMAYSRWWRARVLAIEGDRLNADDRRRETLGPFWSRCFRVGDGLDRRVNAIKDRDADRAAKRSSRHRARVSGEMRRSSRMLAAGEKQRSPRPRKVDLHPFRNRAALFEELSGAVGRTTFFAASTLVFLGAVLSRQRDTTASDVDIFLLALAAFGFLFATLMFGRLTSRLARRTTIDYDRRFRVADRVSDYFGVFPLLLAVPLVVFRFVPSRGVDVSVAILAITVTAWHMRLSSRVVVDIADNALSTSRVRHIITVFLVSVMAATFFVAIDDGPTQLVTTLALAYTACLVLFMAAASIVPPVSDDVDYGEIDAMKDGQYVVHPWDALSEDSPDYYRRTFGSDYTGDRVEDDAFPDPDE